MTLLFLCGSFLYSFSNAPTGVAVKDCVVFICGCLLCGAFALLMTENRLGSFLSSVWFVMFLGFIVNLLYIILGPGKLEWGGHGTLSGMYYYKTDYATFLLQFLILTQYKFVKCLKTCCQYKKIFYAGMIVFSSFLVVLSGSRIFVVILGVYYVALYFNIRGRDIKQMLRVRTMLSAVGAALVALMCLNLMAQVLPELNLLQFDFQNMFSERNTQGRSVIWKGIAEFMLNRATLTQKLLGVDLVSSSQVNQKGLRAHSMYIYVWYSFGFVGVCLFMVFLVCVLRTALKTKNREIAYLLILTLGQTVISGLTQEIIVYTQQLWFLFMILGIALAEQDKYRFYGGQVSHIVQKET